MERLKRDKNVLMQELVRLRQQQQNTDNQLQTMVQRLQGMEQRQQQMMSFLAKAVQSPGFLAQFVQQQNESNRRISEANKKRRLKREDIADEGERSAAPSEGQIVKYQPMINEASAKAILRHMMKMDTSSALNDNSDSFLVGDVSSSSDGVEKGGSSTRVLGVTLQEVPPASGQTYMPVTSPATAISEIQSPPDICTLVGPQEAVPISIIPQLDVMLPELSQISDMAPENIVDMPESVNVEFIDPIAMPIDIDNISGDPDIDALLDASSNFWEDLLVDNDEVESTRLDMDSDEIESTRLEEDTSKGKEGHPSENGWDKVQNMAKLTEQMGLLTSDIQK